MNARHLRRATGLLALLAASAHAADVTLTNATWTPTTGLYADINKAFASYFNAGTGDTVTVVQSSGGCTKQACAVRDGTQSADFVSLAIASDVDDLHTASGLVDADWRNLLPNHASPFNSPVVFLVRKGNPKELLEWPDLALPGVSVVVINPKLSHSARWFYLAARGAAYRLSGGDDATGLEFVQHLYTHAPFIGERVGASIERFVTGEAGDAVLVSESEALAAVEKFGADKVAVVRPSVTLLEELPVAVVQKTAVAHGAKPLAESYARFLFKPEAQELIARNHYRPVDETVLAKHAGEFPPVVTFTIDDAFGGWSRANARFFADGAEYDLIAAGHSAEIATELPPSTDTPS